MSIDLGGLHFRGQADDLYYELDQEVPFSVAAVNKDEKIHPFYNACEKFFGFREIAYLSNEGRQIEYCKVPWYQTLLKVLGCATVVAPLICLAGKIAHRKIAHQKNTMKRIHTVFLGKPGLDNCAKILNGVSKELLSHDNIFFTDVEADQGPTRLFNVDGNLSKITDIIRHNPEMLDKLKKPTLIILRSYKFDDWKSSAYKNALLCPGASCDDPKFSHLDPKELWLVRQQDNKRLYDFKS
jgi:hypothetical protein